MTDITIFLFVLYLVTMVWFYLYIRNKLSKLDKLNKLDDYQYYFDKLLDGIIDIKKPRHLKNKLTIKNKTNRK